MSESNLSLIDEFKITLGDTIMLYQVVENDIRIIRAQMRSGDPKENFDDDKEKYKGMGQIIYALEELDKNNHPQFFADDVYRNLKRISHFRNFYCHECAISFAYESEFPNANFNNTYARLKRDHTELYNLFQGLEAVKHKVLVMYRREA